tara:strand:- start:483 stop:1472 length:990 start_codon:yes stop_codon:yes gene_type:complete
MRLQMSFSVLCSTVGLLSIAAIPLLLDAGNNTFWMLFIARVLIYAIAATALNIVLGLGGLVSLGHALFLGIGMYSVALSSYYGIDSGWAHLLFTCVLCAGIGGLTGFASLRTSGIAFIMITLAFAQMGYFVIVSLKQFGGDDGLSIANHSNFSGLVLGSVSSVYYAAWLVLTVSTYWIFKLRSAPFGIALRAGRLNPNRVQSLGLFLPHYQLAAYVISAVLCGVAGLLLANLNAYASPSSMSWMVSGELIVMIVLGGLGTVMGPALGAIAYLGVEEVFKSYTEHWMAFFGLAILAVALAGKAGILGVLRTFFSKPASVSKMVGVTERKK